MLPYKTILSLNRSLSTPLYIQLSNEIIKRISNGIIPVALKLPGGRKMGELLGVSRRTVILAYEELEAQGWIEIKKNKGTFVHSNIPILKRRPLKKGTVANKNLHQSAFSLNTKLNFLSHYVPPPTKEITHVFDTGYPDVRLAPSKTLSQNFNRAINNLQDQKIMNYASDFYGHNNLRKSLVAYLNETRGILIEESNLLITRGSLMAFNNIFQVLLEKGDNVVVGDVSFKVANNIIKICGGNLLKVPVDDDGIDVDAIEHLCRHHKIRCVFVMPHHHHPTTVTLTPERRTKLLMLAAEHKFAIIEDDYDYDFHYSSSPVLPMASSDENGTVIYVGSFSKTIAPGLRIGFIAAPENFIADLVRLSRFLDCHGNTALEKSIAEMFDEGIIRRHLKKSLKIYRFRRDLFCQLLNSELQDYLQFDIPEGGLAAWVNFKDHIPVADLRNAAMKNNLLISKSVFSNIDGQLLNSIRMGFSSMNEKELIEGVSLLKKSIFDLERRS